MTLGADYCTLAEMRSRLGITDATNTSEDSKISAAITAASRGIEKACNRQFNDAGSATARVYYVKDWYTATVDDFSTTSGLVVKTDSGGNGTYLTTWASTDYQVEPLNGIVDGETGWPYYHLRAVANQRFIIPYWSYSPAGLQVTARWGWTAVPAPVKEGCLILAEEIYKLKDLPFGVGGYGQFGIIRARQNPMVAARIMPYVNQPILVA